MTISEFNCPLQLRKLVVNNHSVYGHSLNIASIHNTTFGHLRNMISLAAKLVLASCLTSFGTALRSRDGHQLPLTTATNMTISEPPKRIYGTNNATYGPVPEDEQFFKIEFLEIAPSPFRCKPPRPRNTIGRCTNIKPTAIKSSSPGSVAKYHRTQKDLIPSPTPT